MLEPCSAKQVSYHVAPRSRSLVPGITIGPRASVERRVELDLGRVRGEGGQKPSIFDQSGP